MRTLLLVRHAPTTATRASAFPAGEELDEQGREQAAGLAPALPRSAAVIASPARRCRQTAEAAGLDATVEDAIGECDFGTWAGSSLAEINDSDPEAVRAWMLDPGAAPHGGESLAAFSTRVARWMDAEAGHEGPLVAITHAEVIKAAVVHALGAPLLAFWRIDASPLAITELHGHAGSWTVTGLNCPALSRAPRPR